MRITYCDCCGREIRGSESVYSIEINKGEDPEHILPDICKDCYQDLWIYLEDRISQRSNPKWRG